MGKFVPLGANIETLDLMDQATRHPLLILRLVVLLRGPYSNMEFSILLGNSKVTHRANTFLAIYANLSPCCA